MPKNANSSLGWSDAGRREQIRLLNIESNGKLLRLYGNTYAHVRLSNGMLMKRLFDFQGPHTQVEKEVA